MWADSTATVLRALANWSGALMGVLLIVVGGLVQAAIPWPGPNGLVLLPLPITLQLAALLLTALVCGQRAATLAVVAYLSIGLFQIPVFHGGGGLPYLLDPGFGYLAGFVPAAWLCGRLSRQNGMDDPLTLAGAAMVGVVVVQICGALNLILGSLAGRWDLGLASMLLSYAVIPLLPQLLICCAVGVLAMPLRRMLLVSS